MLNYYVQCYVQYYVLCIQKSHQNFCVEKKASPTIEKQIDAVCDGLNMLGPGSGTIRRYGLVGVGVVLLE